MAVSPAEQCKRRLKRLVARLPEVELRPGGEHGRHLGFGVRNKTFAYFTHDHHGDGRLALICRAPAGEQAVLTSHQPDQFFVPPYLGHRGWVGMWLDVAELDWSEATEMMIEAYRLAAPKRLAAKMDATKIQGFRAVK